MEYPQFRVINSRQDIIGLWATNHFLEQWVGVATATPTFSLLQGKNKIKIKIERLIPRGRVDDARPAVKARFEPWRQRPLFAPTCNDVCVCGRDHTEAREREWAEGTVSILSSIGQVKFCHSTGIARSGGGVRDNTTRYAWCRL